ncbi:ABC transporter permease [Roseovarius sp. SYSU LYC5161]|uniref:ABC transporter permease n=1 Tax=Roseovarius halophilus (ex Wu et al. 2025) TaxID=3376060 RepID=UPI00287286BC|nr:ABC transporter permease [Roseovarius sp.]
MFQNTAPRSRLRSSFALIELIYHATVRHIRKGHGNAFLAIGINMLSAIIFVTAFYLMFSLLGLRGAKLRGDFMLYMLSGIFLFLTHVKALGAVAGAEGPTSPMMQHAPMNTVVSIVSAALSSLYIQVLSMVLILFAYHVAIKSYEIHLPVPAFGMFLLAWFTGCALGVVMLALKPWFPNFVSIATQVYQRANMIASGKMFVANALPPSMIAIFDWNPLFHAIDQCRGFTFVNYFPRNTSVEYPLYVGIVLLVIGMLGEFYTRQYASSSWNARR